VLVVISDVSLAETGSFECDPSIFIGPEGTVDRLSTEEHPVFAGTPADGWEKHLCDAMRYASKAVKKIGESSKEMTLEQIEQMQRETGYA